MQNSNQNQSTARQFLHTEQVDIFTAPGKIDQLNQKELATQITIGDLHSNAMKLMFMLVKHGIATITNNQYETLVDIYKKSVSELTKDDLDSFNRTLSQITFQNNNVSLLRLLGDELADRGQNDYFILKILEKLNKEKIPVEILVSNHSIEFIEAYETNQKFLTSRIPDYANSLSNLQALVDKNIVTREEILSIVDKFYKPMLRAISYSLSNDKKEIDIYSHAPIDLGIILSLARKLGVNDQPKSAIDWATTIDNINIKFQCYVNQNEVHKLYQNDKIFDGYDNELTSEDPFEFIILNRFYDNLTRECTINHYIFNFVHGHDSPQNTNDSHEDTIKNIYNLDNMLGKTIDLAKGKYTVLKTIHSTTKGCNIILQVDQTKTVNIKFKIGCTLAMIALAMLILATLMALSVLTGGLAGAISLGAAGAFTGITSYCLFKAKPQEEQNNLEEKLSC